ncbi:MAG: Hsp70 family protein [Myxococcales bacterium]|nr:Hsp70 family protein [Myxococcales bacterium]
MKPSRYVVGIDLGTTHSAVAFVDTRDEKPEAKVLPIPQLVAPGTVDDKSLLPSFLYFAHDGEGKLELPWGKERFTAGELARARGVEAPGRVVASAKSWLCHPALDRRGAILPQAAPEDLEKISPVEASFRYLDHVAAAFDHYMAEHDPGQKLADQDVVLTVPASFDAAARELTVEAARSAGLERLTLLEEPQAALYAWTLGRGDAWRKDLKVGDVLLVIDVGGGTTDFSAICVRDDGGSLALERVAVGDHILLGGDNMDLFLMTVAKDRLAAQGKTLDAWQMASLTFACRAAKEKLLADDKLDKVPVAVASRGAKLVGGTLKTELLRDDVVKIILEGFFPKVDAAARPDQRPRAALTRVGLPYAQDAAVTKHLAAFLGRQAAAAGGTKAMLEPTCLLFNGGVMKSPELRSRTADVVGAWLEAAGAPRARVLEGADYDLSVARGAAYFGLVKRGRGIRIRGGTAQSYYVGVEAAVPAIPGLEPPVSLLCVAPAGMEEGTSAELSFAGLAVVVGEPVDFRFFGSSARKGDAVGAEVGTFPLADVTELAPIRLTLPSAGRRDGDVVPVKLSSHVTAIGTLEVTAIPDKPLEKGEAWKVELSVREGEDRA